MDRREFLAGLMAAAATPALANAAPLPHGFFWDGDTLRLSGQTIYVDKDFTFPDFAKNVHIDNCVFHLKSAIDLSFRNTERVLIEHCQFNYTIDIIGIEPAEIPSNLTGITPVYSNVFYKG